ncbi:Enoyl-CoA hydratase/carnithine racemase [Saccharopolyspora shandongensis]|uniref:Enoyl-CoA hydratase/carnithine racemase n=1 Tax=Saccharopolyspora shandongensis TaxID=418495 RepID=A0A1H3B4U5_9PSEU|nr:enoyl-CoA hydratase/isomerase family protein [Saccharopolyspora shandongensis]SDX36952.1 Enoyl-CoA hydratase/carnithine racemase [Saccharopolyspora shandongensis]
MKGGANMASTPPATVSLDVDGAIARIIIDNAARANALNRSMLDGLAGHLDTAARRADVSVIILSGAGPNFCAGLDISEIAERPVAGIEEEFVRVEEILAGCPKPTIAAIRGHCVGGGAQLAVACDLRITSEQAKFAITPAKLGLIYPTSSLDRLVRIIGPAATKRLIFTADAITASTALHYGLVTDVVDEEELDAAAHRIAATIATRAPTTIAAAKQMTDEATVNGRVTDELHRRWQSAPNPDLGVGLAAFAARAQPVFGAATNDPRKVPNASDIA